jgi:protein-S-isoprenylcysteine O-methyltransferase
VALLGCVLGILWGANFACWIQLSLHLTGLLPLPDSIQSFFGPDRIQLLWQWCSYAVALCTFHLSEFFTTAIFNPTAVTAESFLVSHSTGYTAAALTSWTEFGIRFLFFPRWNSLVVALVGLLITAIAQTFRSLAMATAAESFNHMIQLSKKDTHVLVTHGIYSILRHPSYVGFYYWSVSMQLVLGNFLHAILFAVVSWSFFNRRIPFEEESLCKLFPDEYPAYVSRSWTGIPFIYTQVVHAPKRD